MTLRFSLLLVALSLTACAGEPGSSRIEVYAGEDAERIFVYSQEAGELHALAASDGSIAWQAQPGCEWASYASGVVVCGRTIRESSCEESD